MSAIDIKYRKLGGTDSFIGRPTNNESTCADGQGKFRHFEHGSIYWHQNTGAFEVHGAIRAEWERLGWENSFLGYPMSDEMNTPDNGRYNRFQNGFIVWTRESGAKRIGIGQYSNHTDPILNFDLLQSTNCGNLQEFHSNMMKWYGIDLKKSIIKRKDNGNVLTRDISGWQFVDFKDGKEKLNYTSSGDRLILTVARILLMQWHLRDLKNHKDERRAEIRKYCNGCFKSNYYKGWKYHKWCTEFVSYVWKNAGYRTTITKVQSFMCKNIWQLKKNQWCARNVKALREYFRDRKRSVKIKDVRTGKYPVRAGDYLYKISSLHSMIILGCEWDEEDPPIGTLKVPTYFYIVEGNAGPGAAQNNGKTVKVGRMTASFKNLRGTGCKNFEFH